MPSLIALSGAIPTIFSPFKSISPLVTFNRPNTDLTTVDLPAPFGPIIATISDDLTLRLIPLSISVSPYLHEG